MALCGVVGERSVLIIYLLVLAFVAVLLLLVFFFFFFNALIYCGQCAVRTRTIQKDFVRASFVRKVPNVQRTCAARTNGPINAHYT